MAICDEDRETWKMITLIEKIALVILQRRQCARVSVSNLTMFENTEKVSAMFVIISLIEASIIFVYIFERTPLQNSSN